MPLRKLHPTEYGYGCDEPDGTVTNGALYVSGDGVVRFVSDNPEEPAS